ncbi:MAG: ATP synthase subunit alpha [Candidatus Roizmanbacteria bacterium GW2011_GWA2_35_8]|uniref:ATP synthase subunit alpha n=1 Tax=Candidatus Roizmanbacteria bacterium GW2011_GWA2_35_8 TaxID=1618479 RepID=A0A0G0CW97_9BACT|nr:MAG: ATP synthase subunit alpha [Candidatus Roizmanbacteria bacterium GW2011_GWA2_35_8]
MQDYKYYLEKFSEYGEVVEVKQSLVVVEGLPNLRINEIVVFEDGGYGQVTDISDSVCRVALLKKTSQIKSGEKVSRTDSLLTVPVGEEFLGTMINPMGEIIAPENKTVEKIENKSIESEIGGIDKRAKIDKQLLTGVTLVDMLLPLGNGQKELVIGDRKTGKTSFLLTTVKNQIKLGKTVIFAAIGKKKTDINKILNYFISEKIIDKIIFIASGSDDSENLIYLTPYTAMTMAEYFRDRGTDTLVVFDDLSTHAKIYRQIALNSDKFPGRESYPGDIFYLHAHLLERAGNFTGGVSITCLPVAETIEGDLSGYITTNLMGITDGHIYFDRSIFTKGRRPAINLPLSVTRVGRQTQAPIYQQANHEVTAFLSEYESLQNLAHFGAELSPNVKRVITRGERIIQIFDQKYSEIISSEMQLILLALAYCESYFDIDINKLKEKLLKEKNKAWIERVGEMKNFKDLLEYLEKNKKNIC